MRREIGRTWDRQDDMAYFAVSSSLPEYQIIVEDPRIDGSFVLDFSRDNHLVGVEMINASLLLGETGMYLLDDAPEP